MTGATYLDAAYFERLGRAVDAFHRVDRVYALADPNRVHHFYDLELDELAGVWAVDDVHALQITDALRDVLRLLLDDDTLELDVSDVRLCVADG
jgi:hypothetical protein